MKGNSITILFTLLFFQIATGQNFENKLKITPLTKNFYVYETYHLYKDNLISANGMYVVSSAGVILIDSPWDTTQFQPLLDSIKIKHNKNVVMCIATHFHDDRTAGLEYYKQKGIKTYTTKRTDGLSKKMGMKRAEFLIDNDTSFRVGQYSFQTYFPGHGHAPDNIVIWFEKEKILYGGCLIKSVADQDLGNLGDASIKDYDITLTNVLKKCKDPKFVIPGHDVWTDTRSLAHTLEMAQKLKQEKKK
ncbi:MAG: BlaB/IND/MUS family subclass B1 metallo-beta-lactamase [Bacteroidetes bacterium]|nr:BlaB/IND/MUS family subclass B1 metallo-beta-lactamase [Bacteroidota bacterium]